MMRQMINNLFFHPLLPRISVGNAPTQNRQNNELASVHTEYTVRVRKGETVTYLQYGMVKERKDKDLAGY